MASGIAWYGHCFLDAVLTMNGGADLGGMQGFGPVNEEPNEPHFHADWEAAFVSDCIVVNCGSVAETARYRIHASLGGRL